MKPIPDPTCVTVEVEFDLPLAEARRALTKAILDAVPVDSVDQQGRARLVARTGPWYVSQELIVADLEETPTGTRAWVTSQDYASYQEEYLSANADNVSRIVGRLAAQRYRVVEPRRQRPSLAGWHYALALALIVLIFMALT